jgi:hypothetical protein
MKMPRPRFPFVAMMLVSLVGSFVGGVVFSRWFELHGTGQMIRDRRRVTTTGSSNSSADEPLITAQLLRTALNRACENSDSRDFYGPGAYNIPRSLWDAAIEPTPELSDQSRKSMGELRDEKGFQKEVEGHLKELENVCRTRDRLSDTDLMLPLEWFCEEYRLPEKPSPDWDQKFKDWGNFPARHHLSEERFSEFLVAFELAVEAAPEGHLREQGQCLRISRLPDLPKPLTLHVMEADAAQGTLCDARDAIDYCII